LSPISEKVRARARAFIADTVQLVHPLDRRAPCLADIAALGENGAARRQHTALVIRLSIILLLTCLLFRKLDAIFSPQVFQVDMRDFLEIVPVANSPRSRR